MEKKIIIYREKGFEWTPVYIEINNGKLPIGRGEKKEITLPVGKYKISASGWFGLKGSKEIEIKENESKFLLLTQIISPEISLVGISILSLTFVLLYIGVMSVSISSTIVIIICLSVFLCTTLGRKKYYRFKEKV